MSSTTSGLVRGMGCPRSTLTQTHRLSPTQNMCRVVSPLERKCRTLDTSYFAVVLSSKKWIYAYGFGSCSLYYILQLRRCHFGRGGVQLQSAKNTIICLIEAWCSIEWTQFGVPDTHPKQTSLMCFGSCQEQYTQVLHFGQHWKMSIVKWCPFSGANCTATEAHIGQPTGIMFFSVWSEGIYITGESAGCMLFCKAWIPHSCG